ncbi:MAG: thiol peroxidase [Chloroflexi bacterium]|nr:thiol peroxidase [Ardenticatenaceae bacterium]MBL1127904.1 thiol peroxidase [Chloroflexota bacterium]NOG33974.1 thiol peroxidase [Chloroflexota bacterium]GIK55659.1 MAG: putative thiol peroxidase [Chloroflexota bacterium]
MTTIRTDVVKLGNTFATLLGDDVAVGQIAPAFTAVDQNWASVNPLAESKDKVIILSAVPSLDTDVCDRETRRFNEKAAQLGEEIIIYTISTDFPMAQRRWCGAAGVDKVKVISDVLETEFGLKYGLLIKERRYLRRAVFIVGREGVLRYVNYLPSLGQEPDYEEVIAAAKETLAQG